MKKLVTAALCVLLLSACQSGDTTLSRSRRALEAAGYTQISQKDTTWSFFTGCGEKDSYSTRFSAVGPTGVAVEGEVCMGTWKGSTIRLD